MSGEAGQAVEDIPTPDAGEPPPPAQPASGSLPWGSTLDPVVPPEPPEPVSNAGPERPWYRHNLFGRWWSDQKFLIVHWWPAEFRHTAFVAPLLVGTLGASRSDQGGVDLEWERRFDANTTGDVQNMFNNWTTIGNTYTVALGLGGTWLLAHFTGNERLLQATSLSAEALLDEGLYVEGLKRITARTRPNHGGTGEFFSYNPPPGQSASSFPSGHAMGAFAVATVFADVYSAHRWVPWVAYGSAVMVGASRVALGRHFPSDVLVGSVLGNSFGRMVMARESEEDSRRPLALSHFSPIVDPTQAQYGVGWTYAWGGKREDAH